MAGLPDPQLRAQGAVRVSPRGGWRLGWLNLTETALTFESAGRPEAMRIDLASVTRLDAEWRRFVLATKRVVRLTYQQGRAGRPRFCWLITARLADWAEALGRRASPAQAGAQASGPLAAALAGLTGTPALLLDYLARRGHATTAELAALAGAETEQAVLPHLREGMRQVEKVLGGPAVRYEGAYFDRSSGVVRHQAWRLGETLARAWLASRVPTEVLAEGGELLVVTSVPTHARGAPPVARIDADGRGLVLRGGDHDRWIALPESVAGEPRCAVSATGTLVIRARRTARGEAR